MATKNAGMKNQEKIKERLIETEEGRFRVLSGYLGLFQRVLLCSVPIVGILFMMNIHMYFGWYFYTEQYIGLFITLILVGTFISTPATRRSPRNRLPWYDALLALAGLPAGLYLTFYYPELAMRLGSLSPDRAILGAITILLVLEAIRRYAGWVLVIVISIFILYGRYANLFPGTLHGRATSWERLASYLYLDPNSMLNLIAIAAGIALAFILFGQVLISFGGGKHLTDIALLGFGRFRGGPAKAAVVGSSLLGTLSGGAISNVLISGSVTIPMMIRTGYKPAMAGAVESIASSGGNLMPPVMGAVAFLMAENLEVPYAEVAIAALVPAVLFYLVCFVQVDLQAGKEGLRGLDKSEILKRHEVLREAWVVIPCLGILIYTLLIIRLTPSTAGIITAFASVPILLMAKSARVNFMPRILATLEGTGKMLMNIGTIIAGAGIIVGIANISGFGFNLAYTLSIVGEGNLLLLLILAALTSMILGMGMPALPAYALLATLVAPALVQLGVVPMAAHLFILYFAMVSNWTPPIALACFAASTISGANPNRIGLIAVRLGILAYIIPFLFVYSPALILKSDSWIVIVASVATAVIGSVLIGIGLVGYLFQIVPTIRRVLFTIAGIALLIPFHQDMTIIGGIINGSGFLLSVFLILWEWRCNCSVAVTLSKRQIAQKGSME